VAAALVKPSSLATCPRQHLSPSRPSVLGCPGPIPGLSTFACMLTRSVSEGAGGSPSSCAQSPCTGDHGTQQQKTAATHIRPRVSLSPRARHVTLALSTCWQVERARVAWPTCATPTISSSLPCLPHAAGERKGKAGEDSGRGGRRPWCCRPVQCGWAALGRPAPRPRCGIVRHTGVTGPLQPSCASRD
jgi:hypothetical protein